MNQYPYEFSGGMRQRVVIAMPWPAIRGLMIADRPTTALDVTIQARIIDLLKKDSEKNNTTIVMITHDLGVVAIWRMTSSLCTQAVSWRKVRLRDLQRAETSLYGCPHKGRSNLKK